MLAYKLKVRLFKNPRLNAAWRRRRAAQGVNIGDYKRLPDYVRRFAPGKSFIDVGCMWGVNGEYSFVAEEAGAARVTAVDVFGPTPEFEQKKAERSSSVEFVLGDATRAETVERIGTADVVLCAGVLYHHPSPFDLLVALRRLCRETLILRTATILEIDGLPNAAVYFPMLDAKARKMWDLASLGLARQVGITDEFQPAEGYGNWFWGLTPSCVISLLKTAGFEVTERATEAFVETFVCRAVAPPIEHALPSESEAREMAADISALGIARPA
jgi:2-polyprenyl-3-methyl-5-hydroxy-6-metoxy-1,4-benzoquinol methylase